MVTPSRRAWLGLLFAVCSPLDGAAWTQPPRSRVRVRAVRPWAAADRGDDAATTPAQRVTRSFDLDVVPVDHLRDFLPELQPRPSPLAASPQAQVNPRFFVEPGEVVLKTVIANVGEDGPSATTCFAHAGPREEIFFDPATARAAIVTCGGICPGINTVVRELVLGLWNTYGVREIWGVLGGYRGFVEDDQWRALDPDEVDQIHRLGGTVLGTSRGGHDTEAIVDALQRRGINQVYVIGGDGTMRGAGKIAAECKKRRLAVSVAAVPKTVDNDIPIIDKSFGFDSAVGQAQLAIDSAHTEVLSFPNGVGVVQLMGRHSGFIAMHAALGSRDVDCVLIPEVPFQLEGPGGLFEYLHTKLVDNGHVLVVVAEGSGQDLLLESRESLGRDVSGNVKLADIGAWLVEQAKEYFADPDLPDISLKYVDPTYMVRSVRANTADNVYCTVLAHGAVHGVMAGMTNFCVGPINGRHTYIPIPMVSSQTAVVAVNDRAWSRVVSTTGQPDFRTREAQQECSVLSHTQYGGCTVDLSR